MTAEFSVAIFAIILGFFVSDFQLSVHGKWTTVKLNRSVVRQ